MTTTALTNRSTEAAATVRRMTERAELRARARARDKLEWRKAKFDIELFVRKVSPQLEAVPHLAELDEVLNLSMRKPIIALVEAPPRHGKTNRLLHHAARRLKYFPTDQVAYASYSGPFANRKSREVRKLAARAGLWVSEGVVKSRQRSDRFSDPAAAISYWQTRQGGAFVAGGRGGGFVGEGFHLILVDDPFKNRAEAESPVVCDSVFEDLFQGTLFTRLEPNGSMIITHQAWNDEDLIARVKVLLKEQGIEHEVISLKAVTKAKYDSRGRLTGGTALWKRRYPIARLRKIQGAIGAYNFESQYQSNRLPKGKRIFQDPQCYAKPHYDNAIIAISCDPGIVEDRKRDPSAYVVATGYLNHEKLVCMDILLAEEQHEEIPETVDRLELLHRSYQRGPIILEEVSAFQSISQIARRLDQERAKRNERKANLPITSWIPEGSKFVRAHPAASGVAFGRVRVPVDAPWVEAFVNQLKRFTGRAGGKDGMVDALTQLYDYFEKRLVLRDVKSRKGGERVIGTASPF